MEELWLEFAHITETIPEMINQTGIEIAEVDKDFCPNRCEKLNDYMKSFLLF
ncbi:MAG: hypothetical protein IPQ19_16635 [Bacteroidetes bacterium]|nr:hypothetical protein [Bacteroidota bacterium]